MFRFVLFRSVVLHCLRDCPRHDLISSRAQVHQMVDVDRLLHRIKNSSQENEISALHRAPLRFFIHRFQHRKGIGLRGALQFASELFFERGQRLVAGSK